MSMLNLLGGPHIQNSPTGCFMVEVGSICRASNIKTLETKNSKVPVSYWSPDVQAFLFVQSFSLEFSLTLMEWG